MSLNAVQVWQHVVAADNVENGASHAQTGVVHIKEKGTELIGRQQVVGAARCGNQRVLFQLVLRGMDRLELPCDLLRERQHLGALERSDEVI